MTKFRVTSPDGQMFDVDGPEGSTQDQAIAFVKSQQQRESKQDQDRTLLGAVGEGITNIPASGGRFVNQTLQAVAHPQATLEAIGNLGEGVAEKIGKAVGIGTGGPHEQYADAVWGMLKDRYGSWQNIKKTLAKDPVGFFADVSLLAGGGAGALRTVGAAGKVADTLGTVSRVTDPINAAGKVAKLGGHLTSEVIGGPITNVGGEAVRRMATSGYEGGSKAEDFTKYMRGQASVKELVEGTQDAVANIKKQRGQEYRRDIKKLNNSRTILSWNDVDTALDEMDKVATYSGRSGAGPTQIISDSTEAVRNQIKGIVENWKNLRASEFGTVEGFDMLKQKIGDVVDATEPGSQARKVATEVYNAVRGTIIKQDKEYAGIMKSYEEASGIIKEMERTLSLGENATVDTAARKLLSTLRQNVNTTAFGRRGELAEMLTKAGDPNLMEKLAGVASSGLMPHGLQRMWMTGEAGALMFFHHPYLIPLVMAMHSPRITAEVLHAGGKVAKALKPLRQAAPYAYQAGRAKEAEDKKTRVTVHPQTPYQFLDNPSGIDLQ